MSKEETGYQPQFHHQPTIPAHFPTPVMYNSPFAIGAPAIRTSTAAFVVYAILFIIALFMIVFVGFILVFLLVTWNTWDHHIEIRNIVMTFTLVEFSVAVSQAITFGLAAFRKDWLLSGNIPLKLSPLAFVPLISIIIVSATVSISTLAHLLSMIRLVLYFILAFWDKALPYRYA
jgi:hypothetical protein